MTCARGTAIGPAVKACWWHRILTVKDVLVTRAAPGPPRR